MRSCLFLFCASSLVAQPAYDLLLKGGHLIDPKNRISAVRDVAVREGKMAAVAANIAAAQARKVVDVAGLYVTPGLIDLHAHVFGYPGSVLPDDAHLVAGTTTIVGCGGSGWKTFDDFRARIIDKSQTRVLAWLNIVGRGMLG